MNLQSSPKENYDYEWRVNLGMLLRNYKKLQKSSDFQVGEFNGKKLYWHLILTYAYNKNLIYGYVYLNTDLEQNDVIPIEFKLNICEEPSNNEYTIKTQQSFSFTQNYYHFLLKYYDPDDMEENDFYKIKCKILETSQFKPYEKFTISHHLKNIFESPIYPDFTIKCGGQIFEKHKHMLARSPVFARMFESNMKESTRSTLNIEDFSPEIVQKVLEYIYTDNIDFSNDTEDRELFKIAEKYELLGLKSRCEGQIARNINFENVSDTLVLADSHNAKDLKEKAIKFVLLNRDKLFAKAEFKEKILDLNDLLWDILTSLSGYMSTFARSDTF